MEFGSSNIYFVRAAILSKGMCEDIGSFSFAFGGLFVTSPASG